MRSLKTFKYNQVNCHNMSIACNIVCVSYYRSVADPGFSVGVSSTRWEVGGCRPLMLVLFGANVCKMKALGPVGGGRRTRHAPRSANVDYISNYRGASPLHT